MTKHTERLQRYLDRLGRARQHDHEHIHGFDAGEPTEALLLASDIQAAINQVKELETQPTVEPVAWRWSESGGERWFGWTTDWAHHDRAEKLGYPIEYAYAAPTTKAEPAPIPKYQTPHDFKNFHRQLCARFGYVHDEQFWWRDLVSLIEHIASKAQPAVEPVAIPDGWRLVPIRLTQAMADAAKTVDGRLSVWKYDDAYQAMLANAPEAPAPAPNALDAETIKDAERLRGLHWATTLIETSAGGAYEEALQTAVEEMLNAVGNDLTKTTLEQYRKALDCGLDAARAAIAAQSAQGG